MAPALLAMLAGISVTHAAAPAFSEAAYRKHIEVLSSDAFEGRAPGTAGEQKTLAYIEAQFKAAGLQPFDGKSFLQPVPVVEIKPHADEVMQLTGDGGKALSLRSLDDLVVWTRRPASTSGRRKWSMPVTASWRPSTAGTTTPASTCAASSCWRS
jgi:hypothetical protein